jgi:hypothetical protein
MWMFCDDNGVHLSHEKTLKMECFPGDDILSKDVGNWIEELINNGLLVEFEYQGTLYLQVTGWHHQRIEKPYYKYPQALDDGSKIIRGTVPDHMRDKYQPIRRPVDDQSTTVPQPFDDHSTQEEKGKEKEEKRSKSVETTKQVSRDGKNRSSTSSNGSRNGMTKVAGLVASIPDFSKMGSAVLTSLLKDPGEKFYHKEIRAELKARGGES